MKKIFTIIALSALIMPAFAQQDKQLTHYFFNNITTNPGAAGTNENICVGLTLREQWVGFPGNPRTGAFTFSMPLRPGLGGVGVVVIADQLGASRDFTAKASYAYHARFGEAKNRILSFGLNLGILNKGIDFSILNPTQLSDAYLSATSSESVIAPDLGFGVFYKRPDQNGNKQNLCDKKYRETKTQTRLIGHHADEGGGDHKAEPEGE